jgi:RimJ/RimL family protein N-acetyltransferase
MPKASALQDMTDPLLLDLPTSIETERLLVRVPQAGDGLALRAAVAESLPELRQFLDFLPWVANEPTPESSEARCRKGAANFLLRTDLPFLVFEKSSGQLLGGVGLHRTIWSTPKTEVGYWIRTSRAGNGFVTEAVSALVEYAFNQMRAVRVELITDEANAPSRKVADRCRFGLEGVLRNERRAPDDSLRNTCVYAILQRAVASREFQL